MCFLDLRIEVGRNSFREHFGQLGNSRKANFLNFVTFSQQTQNSRKQKQIFSLQLQFKASILFKFSKQRKYSAERSLTIRAFFQWIYLKINFLLKVICTITYSKIDIFNILGQYQNFYRKRLNSAANAVSFWTIWKKAVSQ